MKNRYVTFFLCLFVSVAVWLVFNLFTPNTQVETVNVLAHSNVEGRRDVAYEEVSVTAQCTATGFKLLRLAAGRKAADVFFDASQLEYKEGDFFLIPREAILRHASDIFGADVTLGSLVTTSVLVRFQPENCKKVPVRAVCSINYAPQYMAMGPMDISPDSVLVYGEPSRLESVDYVFTRTLSRSEVKRSLHGSVRLETPDGTRTGISEVYYSQEVARYVQVVRSLPVELRGVPEGRNLLAYPATATVALQYVFPRSGAAEAVPHLYVDYEDFSNSLSGKCMIKSDANPPGVIGFSVNPKFCECVEQ